MASLEELRLERINKLKALEEAGIDAFPINVKRDHQIKRVLKSFWQFQFFKTNLNLVGRIRSIRVHGGATFINFQDGSGEMQGFLSRDLIGKKYNLFIENFDIGDFISVSGIVFKTKKGEKTLKISDFSILAKSIRPLPETWYGLKDIEERFRKRYLDLLMNKDVKDVFIRRSKIISLARSYFDNLGFTEVETPILQTLPGGATARPFITRHNTLDIDLYLRIAPELYLKRLLVAGFDKVYELGRMFRNEGIDAVHNPEFTMLEAYLAYRNAKYLRTFIKNFICWLAENLDGSQIINYKDKKIDLSGEWAEKDYHDLEKKFGGFDENKKDLIQPTFVLNFPKELLPLSKSLNKNKKIADAFQLVIGGVELVKAFSEENNPFVQQKSFEEQEKMRLGGSEEAQRLDEDFVEALEYGMPPAAGFGIGMDRLTSLLTNSHSLREIILFPTMRPKE